MISIKTIALTKNIGPNAKYGLRYVLRKCHQYVTSVSKSLMQLIRHRRGNYQIRQRYSDSESSAANLLELLERLPQRHHGYGRLDFAVFTAHVVEHVVFVEVLEKD